MVAVFWLISVMALYIFTAIQLLDYEDRLVSGQVEGTRASQMAEMGVSVACNPVVERSDYLLLEVEAACVVQLSSEGLWYVFRVPTVVRLSSLHTSTSHPFEC